MYCYSTSQKAIYLLRAFLKGKIESPKGSCEIVRAVNIVLMGSGIVFPLLTIAFCGDSSCQYHNIVVEKFIAKLELSVDMIDLSRARNKVDR